MALFKRRSRAESGEGQVSELNPNSDVAETHRVGMHRVAYELGNQHAETLHHIRRGQQRRGDNHLEDLAGPMNEHLDNFREAMSNRDYTAAAGHLPKLTAAADEVHAAQGQKEFEGFTPYHRQAQERFMYNLEKYNENGGTSAKPADDGL